MLVERLWPRGVSKERAELDLWLKDDKEALHLLKQKAREGTVTLVYASHDEEHNGALALKEYLEHHMS